MMTEERLNEIRAIPYVEFGVMRYGVVLELIAEVERLQAELALCTCGHLNCPKCNGVSERSQKRQYWPPDAFVKHVGPPDTTPCVQVPMADAMDGGL